MKNPIEMKSPTEMKLEIVDAVDYAKAVVLEAEIALHLSDLTEMFGDNIPSQVECASVTEVIAQIAEKHPDRCDVKKLIRGLIAIYLAYTHTNKEADANLKGEIKKGVELAKKEGV